MKKILLGLGSVMTVLIPIGTVVSCSKDELVKEELTEITTINFTSTSNLFATSKSNIEDINQDNFKDAVSAATEDELKMEVNKLKEIKGDQKILFVVTYHDADISVDIQVKHIDTNRPIVTVNKVYLKKDSTIKKENGKNKIKINLFKKYTKDLLIKMIELSKEAGKTPAEIKQELSQIA